MFCSIKLTIASKADINLQSGPDGKIVEGRGIKRDETKEEKLHSSAQVSITM